MALIQTVDPENAEGQAKEIFDTMKKIENKAKGKK